MIVLLCLCNYNKLFVLTTFVVLVPVSFKSLPPGAHSGLEKCVLSRRVCDSVALANEIAAALVLVCVFCH